MYDLRDRVALITGASGGLGAVTARMLADEGAHVAVTHLGHRDEGVEVCRQVEARTIDTIETRQSLRGSGAICGERSWTIGCGNRCER